MTTMVPLNDDVPPESPYGDNSDDGTIRTINASGDNGFFGVNGASGKPTGGAETSDHQKRKDNQCWQRLFDGDNSDHHWHHW